MKNQDQIIEINGIEILKSRIVGWSKRSRGYEYYFDVYLDSGKPLEIHVKSIDTRWETYTAVENVEKWYAQTIERLKQELNVGDSEVKPN